jgi:hypothetical protein
MDKYLADWTLYSFERGILRKVRAREACDTPMVVSSPEKLLTRIEREALQGRDDIVSAGRG